MALSIILNGQSRLLEGLSGSASVDGVVAELGLEGDRVAVELNGEIVPRSGWSATSVNNGDKVEVVHFVGGGAILSN